MMSGVILSEIKHSTQCNFEGKRPVPPDISRSECATSIFFAHMEGGTLFDIT